MCTVFWKEPITGAYTCVCARALPPLKQCRDGQTAVNEGVFFRLVRACEMRHEKVDADGVTVVVVVVVVVVIVGC